MLEARTLATLGILIATACGSPENHGDEPEESFSALYDDVFVPHGCPGCHDAHAPGGLDMTSAARAYEQLVDVPAHGSKCAPEGLVRVLPGDADQSLLVQKLQGHDAEQKPVCGKPMPQTTSLPAAEITRVRAWIDQGAPRG
jgi:hypothetical protein